MSTYNDLIEDVDGLLPCPFCGGEAEILELYDGENAGGSCVSCKSCLASSNVEFGFKEHFVRNWNSRAPDPRDALIRELTDDLEAEIRDRYGASINDPLMQRKFKRDMELVDRARSLVAKVEGK